MFNGKTHYKWPFSIAFCMVTRGYALGLCFDPQCPSIRSKEKSTCDWFVFISIQKYVKWWSYLMLSANLPLRPVLLQFPKCVGWFLYRGAYEPILHVLGMIIIHEHGYPQWNPLTSPYKSQFLLGKSHNYLPIFLVHHEMLRARSSTSGKGSRNPCTTQLVTVPVMLSKTPWLIGFYGSCTAKVIQAILITHSFYQPASINQLGIGVVWENQ